MKLLKKRCIAAAAAGTLAAALLMGCGSSVDDNEIVGTVGESEISFGVANFYLRMVQSRYEAYYTTLTGDTPAEFWLQDWDGGTYQESIKKNLVEKLEDLYLIRQHAQEYDVSLTEEEEKAIAKAAADFEEDNSLEAKELVSGHTEYIQEYLELATIQEKMDEPMKAGVDEDISDEDAAQKSMKYVYFPYVKEDDENSEAISDEEKKELKSKAEKFAKDLQESEEKDIDAAAKEADLEVETVTFDSDTKAPNADFMKAADKLKENEVTDAVESDDGLYVGIVTSLLDREATDTKKEQIIEERKTEQYNSLLKKWREETEISFNEERWQGIDFAYEGVAIPKKEDDAKADNDKKEDSAAEKDTDIEEPGKDSGAEEE